MRRRAPRPSSSSSGSASPAARGPASPDGGGHGRINRSAYPHTERSKGDHRAGNPAVARRRAAPPGADPEPARSGPPGLLAAVTGPAPTNMDEPAGRDADLAALRAESRRLLAEHQA